MDKNNIFLGKIFKPAPPVISARFANYFEIDPKRSTWGPRVIGDYELILVVRGTSSYFETDACNFKVSEGEVLLIPPDTEHRYSCDSSQQTIISCIHFSFHEDPKLKSALIFSAGREYELFHLFKKCAAEFDLKRGHWQTLLCHCVEEIWVRLLRLADQNSLNRPPARLQRATEYLIKNLEKPFSRKALAGHLEVTPEHVNHLFRKFLKETPTDYINKLKINRARELLMRPDLNISQVAYQSGFSDPLYFSRVFKKLTGVSPREYASRI